MYGESSPALPVSSTIFKFEPKLLYPNEVLIAVLVLDGGQSRAVQ